MEENSNLLVLAVTVSSDAVGDGPSMPVGFGSVGQSSSSCCDFRRPER